jgi:hypothetical protein
MIADADAPSLFIIDGIHDLELIDDFAAPYDCLEQMLDWTPRFADVDAACAWFNAEFDTSVTDTELGELLFTVLEAHELFEQASGHITAPTDELRSFLRILRTGCLEGTLTTAQPNSQAELPDPFALPASAQLPDPSAPQSPGLRRSSTVIPP